MTRSSDPGYRILAARSLRKQVKQLAESLLGVRQCEDIESIHHARVASRRLRAALGMFPACWKRKSVKQWKKQLGRLAQNLGEARDHDVLIEFLVSSLADVSDRLVVPGIASLLNHLERQRRWTQPRVVMAVDRFEAGGMLKAMQACAGSILKESPDAPLAVSELATQQAQRCVRKRLKELHEEASGLANPEQHERHHSMRIAAKRLRYTLELARPVYNSDLAETIDAVKRLQTLLGEVHDCDVWGAVFEDFEHKELGEIQFHFGNSRRFERLRPGLTYLKQERKERRCQVFGELAAYWRELSAQGIWDRLAAILEWGGTKRAKSPDSCPAEVS